MTFFKLTIARLLFCLLASSLASTVQAVETYEYQVVDRQAQDPSIFTQGFTFDGRSFYQSSGLYKKSFLVRYSASDNSVIKSLDVPPNIFAEGITVIGDQLFLVSWRAGKAWRFNSESFELEKTFVYSGEGWGLSHNQDHLILSDGSDEIRFLSPDDFSVANTIKVKKSGTPAKNLNELEFAEGLIWANQWKSNSIFGIDPENGEVQVEVDISALQKQAGVNHIDSVANGIAYDADKKMFWITGKYWQYRYLIKILKPND